MCCSHLCSSDGVKLGFWKVFIRTCIHQMNLFFFFCNLITLVCRTLLTNTAWTPKNPASSPATTSTSTPGCPTALPPRQWGSWPRWWVKNFPSWTRPAASRNCPLATPSSLPLSYTCPGEWRHCWGGWWSPGHRRRTPSSPGRWLTICSMTLPLVRDNLYLIACNWSGVFWPDRLKLRKSWR